MKFLGNALVVFGLTDLIASWFFRFDILASVGVRLPTLTAMFLPAICIIAGSIIKRKYHH